MVCHDVAVCVCVSFLIAIYCKRFRYHETEQGKQFDTIHHFYLRQVDCSLGHYSFIFTLADICILYTIFV
jgi:hypothetical protein